MLKIKCFKKIVIMVFALMPGLLIAQSATKPIIMVVPHEQWCNNNGYMLGFNDQGERKLLPDYRRALQENEEVLFVINKISEMMAGRGFQPKDLAASLKSIEEDAAESQLAMNSSGSGLAESPIDVLKRTANADIWLEITWSINQTGPKKSVTFQLRAIDAYTDKYIGGASGTGNPLLGAELAVLLEEAVLSHIDNFNVQLQSHFEDMFEKGREVKLKINVWEGNDYDLRDDLGFDIEDWLFDNTVNGSFNTTTSTENQMSFEQVRIPMIDERGRAVDTRRWTRGLQLYLKDEFGIESSIDTKGLGEVRLTLGEK